MTFVIEAVPAPVAKPKPQRKARAPKRTKVSDALRNAADAYKKAYKGVYGIAPALTYDGTWVRLGGSTQGIGLKRLKELTTQLRFRSE